MTPDLVCIIADQGSSLFVNPLGSRITLTLETEPILVSITRGDGKPGSTHPCTPIFGPDIKNLYGLAQHGNMRNELTRVRSNNRDNITVTHTITDPGFPNGIHITRSVTLDQNTFSLDMAHTNTSDNPVPIFYGEHCYFDAPKGFAGTTINGQNVTEIVEKYQDGYPIPLKPTNLIRIPGKPDIILEQTGLPFAMIWVGTNPSLTKKDSNYICIEPIEGDPRQDFFGSPESLIEPAASRTASFSLSLAD